MSIAFMNLMRNSSGHCVGVVEADVLVEGMSLFLKNELKVGATGEVGNAPSRV